MTTYGYVRVSTDTQDTDNQKLAILEWCRKNGQSVDHWTAITVSSRKTSKERRLDELLKRTAEGDTIIVSDLPRPGRSISEVIQIIDRLTQRKIRFHSIKENIAINGKMDMQTKVTVTLFGLLAEVERDLISQQTREGLARVKASGKRLGRKPGFRCSKLDAHTDRIQEWLNKGISKAAIAKLLGVTWPTVNYFVKTRGLIKSSTQNGGN